MYDLIAYLLSHHGGGELGPSDVQTQEGRDFWQNTQMGGEEYSAEFDRLYLGALRLVEPPRRLDLEANRIRQCKKCKKRATVHPNENLCWRCYSQKRWLEGP